MYAVRSLSNDRLRVPLTNDDLLRMARYRHARANRKGAAIDDYVQLAVISPVLRRLKDEIEVGRDLLCVEELDFNDSAAVRCLTAASGKLAGQGV